MYTTVALATRDDARKRVVRGANECWRGGGSGRFDQGTLQREWE